MTATKRILRSLERKAIRALTGQRNTKLRAVVDSVSNETREMRTLVRRALRESIATGRIVRLQQGKWADEDVVMTPAMFREKSGHTPACPVTVSAANERKLHRAMERGEWTDVRQPWRARLGHSEAASSATRHSRNGRPCGGTRTPARPTDPTKPMQPLEPSSCDGFTATRGTR